MNEGTNMEKLKPRLDPTFNLGHILTIVFLVFSALALWRNAAVASSEMDARVKVLEVSAAKHEVALTKITDMLLSISVNQGIVSALLTEHLRNHPMLKP